VTLRGSTCCAPLDGDVVLGVKRISGDGAAGGGGAATADGEVAALGA
jgi:hypothetical protein